MLLFEGTLDSVRGYNSGLAIVFVCGPYNCSTNVLGDNINNDPLAVQEWTKILIVDLAHDTTLYTQPPTPMNVVESYMIIISIVTTTPTAPFLDTLLELALPVSLVTDRQRERVAGGKI